ncbi:hypothetical protein MTR_3g109270 [Medicago truncatula]|nr:hypothetical protein MTR_3g109270 [Medicago truncatula]
MCFSDVMQQHKYGMRLDCGREFLQRCCYRPNILHILIPLIYAGCRRHHNDVVVLMEGEGTTRCRKGICRVFELLSNLLEIRCNNGKQPVRRPIRVNNMVQCSTRPGGCKSF